MMQKITKLFLDVINIVISSHNKNCIAIGSLFSSGKITFRIHAISATARMIAFLVQQIVKFELNCNINLAVPKGKLQRFFYRKNNYILDNKRSVRLFHSL